jgi:hypothetical protein
MFVTNINDFNSPIEYKRLVLDLADLQSMFANPVQLLPPPGKNESYLILEGWAAQNQDGSPLGGADGLIFQWFNGDILTTMDTFMIPNYSVGVIDGNTPYGLGLTGRMRLNSGLFVTSTAALTGGSPGAFLEIQFSYRKVRQTWNTLRFLPGN